MKTNFDYNEYDSLSLALKANESQRMLSYYEAFGWEEYDSREDRRYFDIVHVKLKRKHKIENKDRLQLLQVKMENEVNRFAVDRKYKHSRSVSVGATLSVFSIAAIGFSTFFIIRKLVIPLAVSVGALGVVMPFITIPLVKKIVENEKKNYALKFKEMTSKISRIISEAKKLSGGLDEKSDKS